MKPHDSVTSRSLTDRIENLDDAALRSGHGLLDDVRVASFSDWLDTRLPRLESQFHRFTTRDSMRLALGR
jgi:hypothetical protein